MAQSKKVEAQRIKTLREKTLRNGKKLTQAQLAERIGVDVETIKRYEKNGLPESPGVRNTKAEQLAQIFGVVPEYIKGETDISDPLLYYSQLEQDRDEAMSAYYADEKARIARYKNLFEMCGFTYEYIGNTAGYDFQDSGRGVHHYEGPHKIRDKNKTLRTLYLTDGELSDLLAQLEEHTLFECFCISRRRRNGNG